MEPRSSNLIVFGEVLFDHFADGQRILGGAPFNVAWALKGFGLDPLFISAVGDDAEGAEILQKMKAWELCCEGVSVNRGQRSGEVRVSFEAGEPQYEICAPRAWDFIEDRSYTGTGWIYHGSLALRELRSRDTLKAILARSSAQRFFDVNLRAPYDSLDLVREWMVQVDWLKLNLNELTTILEDRAISFENSESALAKLRDEYAIKNVLLTAGEEGARIQGDFGSAVIMPAPVPEKIVDTVGAGDACSASVIYGLIGGWPIDRIITKASHFAASICEQKGAISEAREFYRI